MVKPEFLFYRGNDWWRSKVAFILGFVYMLVYITAISFESSVFLIPLILITSIGFSLTGYIINDFFDRKTDTIAGKHNLVLKLKGVKVFMLFVISLLLAITPWFFLPVNHISAILLFFEVTLFTVYSIPVIRLKERKVLGLICDALYAHVVPASLLTTTLFMAASKKVDFLLVVIITLWQFLIGVRNMIIHQLNDIEVDKVSGVRTWVLTQNTGSINRAVRLLKLLDVVLFLGLSIYIISSEPSFILVIALFFTYCFMIFFPSVSRKVEENIPASYYFPNYFYEKILPVSLLLILVFHNWRYLFLLLIHAGLFHQEELKILFFKARLFAASMYYTWKKKFFIPGLIKIKVAGNRVIYCIFKFFGVDLIKENSTAWQYCQKSLFKHKKS